MLSGKLSIFFQPYDLSLTPELPPAYHNHTSYSHNYYFHMCSFTGEEGLTLLKQIQSSFTE